ncbi:MAG: hypothetical protein RMK74_06670 [Myxococcales bacterium]|nr:hypothetical protein [Myxococcales bacterium]
MSSLLHLAPTCRLDAAHATLRCASAARARALLSRAALATFLSGCSGSVRGTEAPQADSGADAFAASDGCPMGDPADCGLGDATRPDSPPTDAPHDGPSDAFSPSDAHADAMERDAAPSYESELYQRLPGDPDPCAPTGADYVSGSTTTRRPYGDPAAYPGTNFLRYGLDPDAVRPELVRYEGPRDPAVPQLHTLWSDDRGGGLRDAYLILDWDTGRPILDAPWPATAAGLTSAPAEIVEVPDSQYDIGGGFDAIVLYATTETITLHYGREDDPVTGYTIHIRGVCVDPRLRALYDANHAAGRTELPTVRGHQPIGRAHGRRLIVAIRDTGQFLDARDEQLYGR